MKVSSLFSMNIFAGKRFQLGVWSSPPDLVQAESRVSPPWGVLAGSWAEQGVPVPHTALRPGLSALTGKVPH